MTSLNIKSVILYTFPRYFV